MPPCSAGIAHLGHFAVEHEGIEPDIITMAKALTAGYAPMGAVLVSETIARHFDRKVLADIAVRDEAAFKALVDQASAAVKKAA